jgi:ribosomal-protein-alanine N-acetyltransferase
MRIETEVCTVRDWHTGDAPALARHADNRSIARNLRDAFPHPYSLADAERFLAQVAEQDPRTYFCIAVEGEAVGGIGYTIHTDVERFTAEIGYWLSESHWGRGISTSALASLTRYAMHTHALRRVYATPYAWNDASVRVLVKAGYVFEGRMRSAAFKEEQVVDQLLYAFTEAELAANQ